MHKACMETLRGKKLWRTRVRRNSRCLKHLQPVTKKYILLFLTLPGGKEGVYDFFIRDYQENVRMILTEEIHTGSNKCTMETTRSSAEEPIFGQTGSANEVVVTRFAKPAGWTSNTTVSVSRVGSLAAGKTGPNSLLKVMAGDLITATADYYYQNAVANTTGNNLTTPVLNALIAAITGSSSTSSLVKSGSGNISTQLGANPLFVSKTAPDANNATGTAPKAYMTILFFDERFNYVAESSTAVRVNQAGNGAAPLPLIDIKAPKNGYVYVYVSNESNEMVYFDNFNVALNRGRIIEEDHYYAYGLKIAAISSQKLGDINEGHLDNKNLYNDKELFDDADLDWYDYGFRNYDAQIGRFTQLDPLTWDYPELTNYQYASCEPIANIDLDGLEKCPVNVAGEAVKTSNNVGRSLIVGGATIGTKVANNAAQRTGAQIINQAFKQGGKFLSKAGGLLLYFIFSPSDAIKGKPDGPPPPGMVWGGDYYVPIRKFEPAPDPKPNPQPEKDPSNSPSKPDDDDDDDQYVYRRGGYTDNTFTPTPGKDDDLTNPKFGLSVDAKPLPGVKSQKISVKKLTVQGFALSIVAGHISIIPGGTRDVMEAQLKDWASTKGNVPVGTVHNPNSHILTKKLLKARVP
jgi:RHS repeat-associated protein